MRQSVKSLGLDRLSIEDQIHLVEELWDTIEAEADAAGVEQKVVAAPAGWLKELIDDRLADCETNPGNIVTWDEAKESILKRHSRPSE